MIIVFGSVNMDLIFNPSHAPAAGETVLLQGYKTFPGGKGANQIVAAARMGADARFVGCTGRDGFGRDLGDVLRDNGVNTDWMAETDTPTGTAVIIVEPHGENRILVAAGANLQAKAVQVPDSALTSDATILMQMECDPDQIAALSARAAGRAGRVILNFAPAIPVGADVLTHVDVFVLNEIEIVQLAGFLGLNTGDDYRAAAAKVAQAHNLTCVITLGAEGAVAFGPDGAQVARVNAPRLDNVVDTTGAGDAFCGTLAACLDKGMDLPMAMERACIVGAMACLKPGALVSYPTAEELRTRFAA